MIKLLKISILTAAFAMVVTLVPVAKGQTAATDIQTQINTLLQQIQALQAKLQTTGGGTSQTTQTTVTSAEPVEVITDIIFYRDLKQGIRGEDVKQLQEFLMEQGFLKIGIATGYYGILTKQGLAKYQRSVGLKPNGIFDASTREYINSLLIERTEAQAISTPTIEAVPVPVPTIPIACPVWSPPSSNWCSNGKVDYSGRDERGCTLPPKCILNADIVAEQVKCVFNNSTTDQKCYSSEGQGCLGKEVCVADIKGERGKQVTWKSTCGGYAYTTIDGANESAEFKCESVVPVPTTSLPVPTTPILVPQACIQVITSALNPSTNECKNFPTPCDVPTWWKKVDSCPTTVVPACETSVTCAIGYTSYDTGEKNSQGCPIKKCISIGNQPPVITGDGPTALKVGEIGSWIIKASDPEQQPLTYSIFWGDETQSAIPNSSNYTYTFGHFYNKAGIYNPTFVVTDNQNLSAKKSFSVNVGETTVNLPPTITEVTGPNTLKMYETGNWTVKASDPEQGILTYSVFWGEDYLTSGTQVAPKSITYTQNVAFSHSYFKAGTYYPTFIVTDNGGISVKSSISVNIGEVTGTGFVRFELLDSSLCSPCSVGTTCAACPPISSMRIYNANITVYDEKGNYIATKDTSSGQATFENLPYGSYAATFSAPVLKLINYHHFGLGLTLAPIIR